MLVTGVFEHSIELEQVLAVVERSGIVRQHILVISMETSPMTALYMENLPAHYSRGVETGMAFATAGAVVGTSVGFMFTWGPIFWGVTVSVICFFLGFGLHRLLQAKPGTRSGGRLPEVTVIIQCTEAQAADIVKLLWQYGSISVGCAPEPRLAEQSVR